MAASAQIWENAEKKKLRIETFTQRLSRDFLKHCNVEVYLEPSRTPTAEPFCEAVNYFCKKKTLS